MRRRWRHRGRSVDRGTGGLSIEPRNTSFRVPTLSMEGEVAERCGKAPAARPARTPPRSRSGRQQRFRGRFFCMACHHVSDTGERPPHIALLGDQRAGLLLRPVRGLPLMVFAPRVPLRSTHGLRSCAASRLNGSGLEDSKLKGAKLKVSQWTVSGLALA